MGGSPGFHEHDHRRADVHGKSSQWQTPWSNSHLLVQDRIVSADRKKPSLYVASMALFRDHVLRAPVYINTSTTVISILESVILFMIKRERTGFIVDRPLIRHCVQMLEGLYETITEEESSKLYLTLFEPAFLKMSAEFYQTEGRTLVETGDAALFCQIATQRIAEEQERSRYTLSIMTEPKILAVLDQELLCKNIDEVVQFKGSGVQHMLDQNQLRTLRSIYELNARIDPKKNALTRIVNKQIVELGQRINISTFGPPPPPTSAQPPEKKAEKGKEKEKEKPINQQTVIAIQWVDDVLALKRHYDHVWEKAFLHDQGLQSSIMASFVVFINVNTRSAEFLSLFFDENLKKGIKGKTEGEVDALLDNGITLLRFIKDKDLFETYYKKHLSRRLLTKRAASMDAERQMISKMKVEVGNQFTQRIEAMFRDMTISEDLSINYRTHIARQGDKKDRVDLDINVLTSTMWPMEVMSPSKGEKAQLGCIFPREIDNLKRSFEAFYLDKHSGRKLTWQANMGTADIRATFQRSNGKVQRYELNVSTYGMFILCLFNDLPDGESLTYEEIEARTRIPEHDLVRNLQSLAVAPRTRVLKKEPMSKDVKPTDKFFFNHEFQSPFVKVRVGVVSGGANKVEDQDQRKETERKMNDERRGSIEAAVVRIMKYVQPLACYANHILTVFLQATKDTHPRSADDRSPRAGVLPFLA